MEDKRKNMTQDDHDLLIELNVLVKQSAVTLDRIESALKDKATKNDLSAAWNQINKNTAEIAALSILHERNKIEKDTIIRFGKFSANAWQFFIGMIVSILTAWQLIEVFIKKI